MHMKFDRWLLFPQQLSLCQVVLNRMSMPLKWSLWTNRALLATTDGDNIRSRLGNQYSVLGSTAGMLVTISAAAFYLPPAARTESDIVLTQIFGICMFLSTLLFISYIVVALTILFPLIESSKDEMAQHILHELLGSMYNLDGILFMLAINAFVLGLLVIIPVVYSMEVLYAAIIITVCVYG